MTTRRLHLMHYSLLIFQSVEKNAQDIEWSMKQGADLISYTEANSSAATMRKLGEQYGYQAVNLSYEAIAVNRKTCTLKDKGKVRASDRFAPDGGGGRQARYVNWVKVDWKGETLWFHNAHWTSLFNVTSPQRRASHKEMSKMTVQQTQKHAQGGALSFFAGDTNDDDGPNETPGLGTTNTVFKEGRLITIWDEIENWPGTMSAHGKTIDVIGKYDPDKRVKGIRGKVHPERNSDHRPISAWYDISDVKEPGDGDPPTGGGKDTDNPTKPPKGLVTGGNVSWKDYRDATVYDVERATESGPDDVTR